MWRAFRPCDLRTLPFRTIGSFSTLTVARRGLSRPLVSILHLVTTCVVVSLFAVIWLLLLNPNSEANETFDSTGFSAFMLSSSLRKRWRACFCARENTSYYFVARKKLVVVDVVLFDNFHRTSFQENSTMEFVTTNSSNRSFDLCQLESWVEYLVPLPILREFAVDDRDSSPRNPQVFTTAIAQCRGTNAYNPAAV